MTSQDKAFKLSFLATSLLLLNTAALAANAPPQEAISACSNILEGSSCSIQTPNGQLSGSCLTIQTQLACVPDSNNPDTNNPSSNNASNSPAETENNTSSPASESPTNTTSANTNSDNSAIFGSTSSSSASSNSNSISIDSTTSSIYLAVVSIDNTSYYEVYLDVVSTDPLILELSSALATNASAQVSAYYNSGSETLSISNLILDGQVTSAEFKRNSNFAAYQFELESATSSASTVTSTANATFNLVDTGQNNCYNSAGNSVSCANTGQDAAYSGNQPNYSNNGNGTITDNVTGLVWQQTPDSNADGTINSTDKMTQSNAESYCNNLVLGNQSDWRLPDIKTLYSLIDFSGEDPSSDDTSGLTPFIDTDYFDFAYGDTNAGERIIDMQYATSTLYVSTTMVADATMFGVNLADGRIKGYGTSGMGGEKTFAVQCVRNQSNYAINSFSDNNDNTISDQASGLMWEKDDSQFGMNWDAAIAYCESGSSAGYSDWRLPNAKELQSIVDYSRSPDTTNSAAINSLFNATTMLNEAGQTDWGFYWSSTTHKNGTGSGANGIYVAFGRALGYMNEQWLDVHGAGAQRSNMKVDSGQLNNSYSIVTDANGNQAIAHGPQGDVVRVNNYVRCVR